MKWIVIVLALLLAPVSAQSDLEQENEQLRADNKRLRQELEDVHKKMDALQSEHYKALRKQEDAYLKRRRETLARHKEDRKKAYEQYLADLKKKQADLDELHAELRKARNKGFDFHAKYDKAQVEIAYAKEHNEKLAHELRRRELAHRQSVARLVAMLSPEARERWQDRVKTEKQIAQLRALLVDGVGAAGAEALYEALAADGGFPKLVEFGVLKTVDTDGNGKKEIADIWGHPIVVIPASDYAKPVTVTNGRGEKVTVTAHKRKDGKYYNADGFQLISLGPDGKPSNDDVVNFVRGEE